MAFEEKTINKNYIYKGRILNLCRDDVLLPNGEKAVREIVEHNGGSCILCEKEGKILLVKQFRYAYKQEIWEIPAGKINSGEDPKETAIRELEEESGLVAENIEKIFEIYPSPGYTNEIIHVYKVTSFREGKVHLDEDEFLESKWFDKTTLKEMIKNGEIKDSKTLIALLSVL